jgi:hypothetical protein
MLNEAAVLTAVVAAAKSTAIGAAKSALVAKGKKLLARFDADERFQTALDEERDQILWTLHAVAIEVAGIATDRQLDGEQAVQLLLGMASDPTTRRRFRALLNEAVTSCDERVAMLATGYFVEAKATSLRDRLDWALRGLFPDDANVLGQVIECAERLLIGQWLIALERTEAAVGQESWALVIRNEGSPSSDTGLTVSAQSLRSLHLAQCLAISEGIIVADKVLADGSVPDGRERVRSLEVLPLGRELHRILGTVDWREIAGRRAAAGVP